MFHQVIGALAQFQQEVLVYDEESGEYHKYLYIADGPDEHEQEVEEHEDNEDISSLEQVFNHFFMFCGIKWPLFFQYRLLCLFIDTTSFTFTHILLY